MFLQEAVDDPEVKFKVALVKLVTVKLQKCLRFHATKSSLRNHSYKVQKVFQIHSMMTQEQLLTQVMPLQGITG